MALNGTRLLGLRTVELMSSTFVEEFGFGQVRPGLGFRAERPGGPGCLYWIGAS